MGGGRWAQQEALAGRLRELQRGSSQGRERWQAWCQRSGCTSYEPEAFDTDFIAAFFESLEAEGWNLPPLGGSGCGYRPQWGGKGGRWSDPYDKGGYKGSEPWDKGGYKGSKGKQNASAALCDAPQQVEASTKIFIGGLPKDTANETEIANHFSAFGEVVDVVLKRDAAGQCKGFGFLTFSTIEAAQKVVDNSETNYMGGKWLDCKFAVPEDKGKAGGKGWAGGGKGWAANGGDWGGGWGCGWGGGWGKGDAKGWGGGWGGWGGKCDGKGWGAGKGWADGGKGNWGSPNEFEVSETVFVGALPKAASEESIREHFSSFGEIVSVLVKLDANGISRGFAFVTFDSVESARKVIDNYDNNIFEGKWVDCKAAAPQNRGASWSKGDGKADSEKGFGKGRDFRSWSDEDITEKIWIGGLPQGTREPEVRAFCEYFGKTREITLKYNSECIFRGFAFVTMETVEAATELLHGQAGHYIGGKQVECRPCAKSEHFPRPSKKDIAALDYDFGPTPLTCGVIRVKNLPPEPKLRDVFKLFFNFSTTRIRDLGGDDVFVEFTSKYEAERAYKMKKGATMGDNRVELVAASEEEFEEARTRLPPVVPTGRMAPEATAGTNSWASGQAASNSWASGQASPNSWASGQASPNSWAAGQPGAIAWGAGQVGNNAWAAGQAPAAEPAALEPAAFGAPAAGGAFGAEGFGGGGQEGAACAALEGGDAVDWTALLAAQNVPKAAPMQADLWWPGQDGAGGQGPGPAFWQAQG